MKAKSVSSVYLDPYRAGVQLAEELAGIKPEVIFLFSSVHYGQSNELTEAIYDVLENDELIIIGTTGDGFYESNRISDVGVAALGINSMKKIQWFLESEIDVEKNTGTATEKCIDRIFGRMGNEKPDLWFMFADFKADSNEIMKVVNSKIDTPMVGGYGGDNNMALEQCFVYADKKVLKNAVVILGAKGEIRFDINVANNLTPVGKTGIATEVMGKKVLTIDNMPAMDFIEKELGKPVEVVDQGIVSFDVIDREDRDQKTLRAIFLDSNDGSVKLFGAIDSGKDIQVCIANPEDVVKEVQTIGASLKNLPFDPVAGIIISCTGRKHLLGHRIEHEVNEIEKGINKTIPLGGFPSFGEIGPIKKKNGYTPTLFHHMTYILLLIGE